MRNLIIIVLACLLQVAQASDIKNIEQKWSDALITAKIKTQFAKNKNCNPLQISVTTNQGEVILKGHAKNKLAFVEALRIVANTKGVHAVDTSAFDIDAINFALTDAYITAKVEAAILKSKVLDDESIPLVGINASTLNGIVTLSGTVQHERSIDAMLKRTYKVHGVKKIISHLVVARNT